MYDSLGAVAYYRGKGPEALTLFDRASRLFQEAGGPESPGLVLSLISAGTVYLKMDRAAEAESALARAEEIAVKAYGPEHPRVAEALTLWIKALRKLGKRKKRPAGPSNASAYRRRPIERHQRHFLTDSRFRPGESTLTSYIRKDIIEVH
jgi:tetratricopeptide (TPR) repeat protein